MKIRQLILALFLFISQGISAQEFFTYDANGAIVGLTPWGMVAETLTIPSTVTAVRSGAFYDAVNLTTLVIDNGNPEFEEALFATKTSTISTIYLGGEMTTGNIQKLILSLGTGSPLEIIEMDRYADETAVIDWTEDELTAILTDKVMVRLPAPLVNSQVFGNAVVQGRFDISGELKTFCGTATFEDTDDGSHMLFYVPTECHEQTHQIYIQRVRYIVAGEGVLIHNLEHSATHAYLKRVETNDDHKDALYANSMMVGVITPTSITPTVEIDGISYTNLGLASNGVFHPLNAGTVPANRAYLQIKTSVWESLGANLTLLIPDEDIDGIRELNTLPMGRISNADHWYTLDGRRLNGKPQHPGAFIHSGHIIVVK
jgi:hypothetical protein